MKKLKKVLIIFVLLTISLGTQAQNKSSNKTLLNYLNAPQGTWCTTNNLEGGYMGVKKGNDRYGAVLHIWKKDGSFYFENVGNISMDIEVTYRGQINNPHFERGILPGRRYSISLKQAKDIKKVKVIFSKKIEFQGIALYESVLYDIP